MALKRQADALEQAEQVKLGLRLHFRQHLVGREIVNPNDDALAQFAESYRQQRQHGVRHRFHLGEIGGFGRGPHRSGVEDCRGLGKAGLPWRLTGGRQSGTLLLNWAGSGR